MRTPESYRPRRRLPPSNISILPERAARFEFKSSDRAAFLVFTKIAEFMVNLTYAAVWYRRMAIQYSPQRERAGNEKNKNIRKV